MPHPAAARLRHSPRRPMLSAILLCIVVVAAGLAPTASAARGVVDLGTPMVSVDVAAGGAGPDADGGGLAYLLSSGHPPVFAVFDAETGDKVFEKTMVGDEYIGGSVVTNADGSLAYFYLRSGSRSILYEFDRDAGEVTEVIRGCSEDCDIANTIMRGVVIGDDGTIFLATYPDAQVYGVHPESGEIRDYGSMPIEGAEYTWGITVSGNDLFVGTANGPELGRVVHIDVQSGEATPVPIPDANLETRSIGDLGVVGDVLVVPFSSGPPESRVGFYDFKEREWVCEGKAPGPITPTDSLPERTLDGKLYFRTHDGLHGFDPSDCSVTEVPADLAHDELRGVEVVPSDAGDMLMIPRPDGSYVTVDPETAEVTDWPSTITPSPVTTHSLGLGPDGKVYVGAYLSPDVMARVDPDSNEVEVLDGPEQSDMTATVNGHLVVSSYPNAVLHAGKTDQPWDWDTNPKQIHTGSDEGQDRIFEIVDAGELGAAGSVPKYAELGGALILFDPATGDSSTYRNVVEDQSVVALAARNGTVYGGTTIEGGIGSEPTTTEAQLFEFDVATRERTTLSVPSPGSKTIAHLAFGDDDDPTLWGITYDNVLFGYDTETHQVTSTQRLALPQLGASWGRNPVLKYRPQDGKLYGVAGGSLFSFDPDTQRYHRISANSYMALEIAANGNVYLINDTNLFTYTPPESRR